MGCASAPPLLAENVRSEIDALEVRAPTIAPEGWKLDAHEVEAMSRAAGAAAGGAGGAVAVGSALAGSCAGAICGAVALVWLAAVATGALVGAVQGAGKAEREQAEIARVAAQRWTFEQVAQELDVAARFEDALVAALPSAAPMALVATTAAGPPVLLLGGAPAPARFALDVQIRDVAFEKIDAADGKPRFELRVLVRYRLIAAGSGAPCYESYVYATRGPDDFETWAEDDAQGLVHALDSIYRQVAEAITDDVLRVYRSRDESAPMTEYDRGYFLDAVYPRPVGGFRPFATDSRVVGLGGAGAIEIDERRPLLRWTSVPHRLGRGREDQHIDVAPQELRYDVRVFDGVSEIERADSLTTPQYQVRTLLAPCRAYFWTFRARFEREGRSRVTDWGGRYSGLETWNARYPLMPGVAGGRDRPSAFADRTLYYHRFWVRGPACP